MRKCLIFCIIIIISCSTKSNMTTLSKVNFQGFVNIGDVDQYFSVRGETDQNPILFFVHGGPGWSENTLLKVFNSELEKHFIVIHWEQRGTGKSYFEGVEKTINCNQMIKDFEESAAYFLEKYDKKKMFIVGHSWGTIPGIEYAKKYPEFVYAYVGISQIFNLNSIIAISYKNAMEKMKKQKKYYNYFLLKKLGKNYNENNYFEYFDYLRDRLTANGMNINGAHNYMPFASYYLSDPEYDFFDLINIYEGFERSLRAMGLEVFNYKHDPSIKLEVPAFLIIGKKDGLIPFEVYEDIMGSNYASNYRYVVFESSGHSPIFEENIKFNKCMIDIKKECLGNK